MSGYGIKKPDNHHRGGFTYAICKNSRFKTGMRLAKPIYNKMGVLLYERDTLLTIAGVLTVSKTLV